MLEMVKERLKSFGYELQEGDEIALTFSIQKVENTIKNDCNTPSIPDGLVNIAVDMVQGIGLLNSFHSESNKQNGQRGKSESKRQSLRIEEKLHQTIIELKF